MAHQKFWKIFHGPSWPPQKLSATPPPLSYILNVQSLINILTRKKRSILSLILSIKNYTEKIFSHSIIYLLLTDDKNSYLLPLISWWYSGYSLPFAVKGTVGQYLLQVDISGEKKVARLPVQPSFALLWN